MERKIKKLSFAFVVAAAISVAAASTVQATQYHVNTAQSAVLTGEQTTQLNTILTKANTSIKCTQAHFEGTVEGEGAQITYQEFTLTPTVTGCTFSGLAATLKWNGCKLTVTNKSAAGVTTANTAYVDLVGCTAGKQLEAGVVGCTITSPEQNNIGHLIGLNTAGPPGHIEVQLTLQGISYEYHGALCNGTQTVLTQDGDLTGGVTLKAYTDQGSEVASHNGHQYNKLKTGTQVGLSGT